MTRWNAGETSMASRVCVVAFVMAFASVAGAQTEAVRTAPVNQPARPVAMGAITFDSKGVEFGPWVRRFVAHVKKHWFVPFSSLAVNAGPTEVTFIVKRDGTISDIQLTKSSGHPALDRSALQALSGSSPVAPLPGEFPDDHVSFTASFLPPRGAGEKSTPTPAAASERGTVLIEDPRSVRDVPPASEVFTIEGGTIYHRHNCISLAGHRKVKADRARQSSARSTACHICLPDGPVEKGGVRQNAK